MADERAFLTPKEVAEFLRVSVMTVHRIIGSGKLDAWKVGSQYRIDRDALRHYLEDSRTVAP